MEMKIVESIYGNICDGVKVSADDILSKINGNEYHNKPIFEWIGEQEYVHPYFDVDCNDDAHNNIYSKYWDNPAQIEDQAIEFIEKHFGEDSDISIATAHGIKKKRDNKTKEVKKINTLSWHFIINNKKIKYTDMIKFKEVNKEEMQSLCFDISPYGKESQKFRLVNTSKEGENRPLKPVNYKANLSKHFITNTTDDEEVIKFKFEDEKKEKKSNKKETEDDEDGEIADKPIKKEIKEDDEINQLLSGLNSNRFHNYNYWIKMVFIFKNEKFDMEVLDEHSKQDKEKYDYEENHKIYNNCKPRDGLTIATLYKWLKEDNYEMFNKLQKNRKDFWKMVDVMNHSDLAKLYYNLEPNKYIRSPISGWYEYNQYNILKHRDTIPSSLLNDLTDKLQAYIIEQRNLVLPDYKDYNEKMSVVKLSYKKVGTSTYVKGIMEYLTNLYTDEKIDDLIDSKSNLIAFDDKVYDVITNKYRDIRPDDYVCKTTKMYAPITRNKEINNKINKLVYSIFEDDELIKYWWITTGISLFTNKMESLYVHTGTGGNGKGLLSEIIRRCLGEYYYTAENSFLCSQFKAGRANPTLASLKGVRYLFVSEPDDGSKDCKFNVDFIKSITGRDPITTRGIFKHNITYIPQFTCMVQCNSKPVLNKTDRGIERRLKIIKYPFEFVDNPRLANHRQKDYSLKDSIDDEFVGEFINMLFEYANMNYAKVDKIKVPKVVSQETDDYIDANNPIRDFLNEYTERTKNNKDQLTVKELMELYNRKNNDQFTKPKFVDALRFNGIEPVIERKVQTVLFIKYKPQENKPQGHLLNYLDNDSN